VFGHVHYPRKVASPFAYPIAPALTPDVQCP
jgi:hypothetical protein